MNYCTLDDAFQTIGGAPSPGCINDNASKDARKEERRKARRCKGPPATYFDMNDPDRPANNKLPDIPAMNSSTGLREHAPVTTSYASYGSNEPFTSEKDNTYPKHNKNEYPPNSPNYDKDPLHNYLIEEERAHVMTVPTVVESNVPRKNYFGASPDNDVFADYIPDQDNYRLKPDFLTAFEHAGVARAGSASKLPNPSVNMYWKPLTTAGAQTSFVEHLPPPGGKYHEEPHNTHDSTSTKEIMKKFDKIFARLDDMNTASPENIASELLMFISSGIFVLFMMDLLVKKGSTLRF